MAEAEAEAKKALKKGLVQAVFYVSASQICIPYFVCLVVN